MTDSCWSLAPIQREGPHPYKESDRNGHNGAPRRAAVDLGGTVDFEGVNGERPQRGTDGSEAETSVDWDQDELEYSTAFDTGLKGTKHRTVAPMSDRKRRMHTGETVTANGYRNHGDLDNKLTTMLERADQRLQSHGYNGRTKELILDSIERERSSDGGLRRWNCHHNGKDGCLVGWTSYYSSPERALPMAKELLDEPMAVEEVQLLELFADRF